MVDNMFGGISQFCHQAGVETKKRENLKQLLEVSSAHSKDSLALGRRGGIAIRCLRKQR
jgi:hypothetical protein